MAAAPSCTWVDCPAVWGWTMMLHWQGTGLSVVEQCFVEEQPEDEVGLARRGTKWVTCGTKRYQPVVTRHSPWLLLFPRNSRYACTFIHPFVPSMYLIRMRSLRPGESAISSATLSAPLRCWHPDPFHVKRP
jgi:hypothetical protein